MSESLGQSTINEHDREHGGGIGQNPGGVCICPICGFRIPHELEVLCYNKSGPKCGFMMTMIK